MNYNKSICEKTKPTSRYLFTYLQLKFTKRSQKIFIICRFHFCKFIYSLKFTVTPKIIHSQCFADMDRAAKNSSQKKKISSHLKCVFLVEVEQGNTLPSCFSSYQCPYHDLISASFWHFCAVCWWFHCLKVPPSTVRKRCVLQRKYT